jgi:tripartite-type tricarboxylate transporter receptor subunit TctC
MAFLSQRHSRTVFTATAALTTVVAYACSSLAAAPFPSRNITLIVAFPPGGPPDVVARIIAPMAGDILGRPIVIENRPGGSATIAATAAARSEPDGHTLLTADLSLVVSPSVVPSITYDPVRDFKMVVQTAKTELTLVINPKTPIKTLADLVAAAKKDPSAIKAAHAGIGSPPHLGLVAFLKATDTQVLLVPYKGSALAIQDIVAGHISLLATGPSTSIGLAKEGKVRMLGTTGDRRLADLPDVPTFKEAGIDMGGMAGGQWFGIAVPAATPDDVVAKINAAVNTTLQDPGVRERLTRVAFEPVGGTSERFAGFFKAQAAYWKAALPPVTGSVK